MPYHLLFPLFSSVCFVFGMMLAKQAIDRGVSPWTGTFLGNLWLALFWGGIAFVRQSVIPSAGWADAAIIGLMFVFGQVFTYLAFQFGDVSVATPIFGVKVLMVAALTSVLDGSRVSAAIWIAGTLASAGVILIQWNGRKSKFADTDDAAATTARATATATAARRNRLTIILALSAAFSLSLFDVCLQKWARDWNSYDFLPVMFGTAGVLSLLLLPWVTLPKRIVQLKAGRWILAGTILMALQAMSMCFSLAEYQDAPRINIVYALRGMWGVLLAWAFAKTLGTKESEVGRSVMLRRLAGSVLLTVAVLMAIGA